MSLKDPDSMDREAVLEKKDFPSHDARNIDAYGRGASIYCCRCDGQRHIGATCATTPPQEGKGNGKESNGAKRVRNGDTVRNQMGKGWEGKGGHGDWSGFCSCCGK